MTTVNELRERWATGIGKDFLAGLYGRLVLGGEITESPFGLHDGRIDLRGFTLPTVERTGLRRGTLRKFIVRNADAGNAFFEYTHFESCLFDNVLFDKAVLAGAGERDCDFVDCSFAGTDMRGFAFGIRGSRYRRCRFARVTFSRAISDCPEFDETLFDHCRFRGLDFQGASFSRCVFRGEVRNVWFRGGCPPDWGDTDPYVPARPNRMEDVSFEKARLTDVTFSGGCGLSTVVLPRDGSCRFYDRWPERLKKLWLRADMLAPERKTLFRDFCDIHRGHAAAQEQYILSRHDLGEDFRGVMPEIMAVLSEL